MVGVDVLRGALEFREGGQRGAGRVGVGVVDFQQHGLVGLDDERTVAEGHGQSPFQGSG